MIGGLPRGREHLRTLAVVAGLILAAGCGGSKAATVTVTQTTTAASTGVNATPPPSSGPTTNASGLVLEQTVNEGAPVTVEGMQFTVKSAKTVSSIPVQYGSPVKPVPGARLVVVVVRAKNVASVPTSPFCGANGAVLGDRKRRNWQWNTMQTVTGGAHSCDQIQPGLAEDVKLVFDVPKAADVTFIALWNSGTDYRGTKYVDVNLR
jgi:hypothetical protein